MSAAARRAPVIPANWRVFVGGRTVEHAASRKAAMGLARWWIRQRRGRIVQVSHRKTGEKWEWRGTTWVPIVAAGSREAAPSAGMAPGAGVAKGGPGGGATGPAPAGSKGAS